MGTRRYSRRCTSPDPPWVASASTVLTSRRMSRRIKVLAEQLTREVSWKEVDNQLAGERRLLRDHRGEHGDLPSTGDHGLYGFGKAAIPETNYPREAHFRYMYAT